MHHQNIIENEFSAIWSKFSNQIKNHGGNIDTTIQNTHDGLNRTLTTVVRIGSKLNNHFYERLTKLSEQFPEHYFYPPSDIHFTIINCTPFLRTPSLLNDEDILALSDKINSSLNRHGPIEIVAKGLNVFPTTVFVQLFDFNGAISGIRNILRNNLRKYAYHPNIAKRIILPKPFIVFANIIRFTTIVSENLIHQIEKSRKDKFGKFYIDTFELVTTDKFLSKEATNIWHTYNL
jgi:2'-5' RNA ligase